MRRLAPLAAILFLLGAGPFYLAHVAKGQASLLFKRRSIEKVLADPKTPPRLRELLAGISKVKAYGAAQGLKPTPNFKDYVALDRPAVTYVVSASKPLRFEAKTWSFPIVGSVTYLGWFDKKKAQDCEADLEKEGWDADLRGTSAYSTLGWFKDPVLSSMVGEGPDAEGNLAETVLHESVHSTLYVPDQTAFNESLADWTAARLARGYLEQARGGDSGALKAWLEGQDWGRKRAALVAKAYGELEKLYASAQSDEQKLLGKNRVLEALRGQLGEKGKYNNASLMMERAYASGAPEFSLLFEVCGKDWGRFFRALRTLTPKSFAAPQEDDFSQELNALSKADCPQK